MLRRCHYVVLRTLNLLSTISLPFLGLVCCFSMLFFPVFALFSPQLVAADGRPPWFSWRFLLVTEESFLFCFVFLIGLLIAGFLCIILSALHLTILEWIFLQPHLLNSCQLLLHTFVSTTTNLTYAFSILSGTDAICKVFS